MEIEFKSELWMWQSEAAWYFVSLPTEYHDTLKEISGGFKRGFGSIKVEVNIGSSAWKTSIFPDNKSKTYLLPIKKSVRITEYLEEGSSVQVKLKILV